MSTSEPSSSPKLGLSLSGFETFVSFHGGRAAFKGLTTSVVKASFVVPRTSEVKREYIHLLASDESSIGTANRFISHAYDYLFLDMLDAVMKWEAGASSGSPFFYYFDLLCVNQHSQDAVVPFEVLRDEFSGGVRGIGYTLLLLKWREPISLTRSWCVFEMATTLLVGAPLEVIMPPDDEVDFRRELLERFEGLILSLCRVDVAKATAREEVDRVNINRAIEAAGGAQRTNEVVCAALREWMLRSGRRALEAITDANERASSDILLAFTRLLRENRLARQEAADLAWESYQSRRAVLGEAHEKTLTSLNLYANCIRELGRGEESLGIFMDVREKRRALLGPLHRDTLRTVCNVGNVLKDAGRLSEAEEAYRESSDGFMSKFGEEDSDTIWATSNLANCLKQQGKLREALPLFLASMHLAQKTLGPEHPDSISTLNGYAHVLEEDGNFEEALPIFVRVLDLRRRVHGESHTWTISSMQNLANAMIKQCRGDFKPREYELINSLLRDASEKARATLAPANGSRLEAVYNLALFLDAAGEREEALGLYEEVLAGRLAAGPEGNKSQIEEVKDKIAAVSKASEGTS